MKSKNHHIKPLANVGESLKKSKGNKKQVIEDCDKSKDSVPACHGCKDDCKYYCQTQSKIAPNPPPPPKPDTPPEDNPCNSTGIRAPGGPI